MKINFTHIKLSHLSIAIIAIISLILIYLNACKFNSLENYSIIDGDGKDYYSYLPNSIIHHNLSQLNENESCVVKTETGNINTHWCGVALLQLPFFMVGYCLAQISNVAMDGYSWPFQFSVSIAALFYAIVGLWFIYKTLLLKHYSEKIISLVLLITFFGSTLLNYTIYEPSMSHVYSFALISIFMYYGFLIAQTYSTKNVYIFISTLACIVLTRQANILIMLMIPFFFNSFEKFKYFFREILSNKKTLFTSMLIFISICGIQSIIWFIQTGKFIQHSYAGNGFYFTNPQILKLLFGFNSGVFIYTPIYLFAVIAFIIGIKKNTFKSLILFLFSSILIYILSSYWGYTYFDGIGTRVLVDYLSLIAFSIAFIYQYTDKKIIKNSLKGSLFIVLFYNLVISFQYKNEIIQRCGMNFEKYKYVFLKTDSSYIKKLGGMYDLKPYSEKNRKPVFSQTKKFNNINNRRFFLFNKFEYGVEINSDLTNFSNKLHLTIGLDRLALKENSSKDALIGICITGRNKNCKFYQLYKLNDTPPTKKCAEWKTFKHSVNINLKVIPSDNLSVFIWNKNKEIFGIDNFKVKIYNYS